MTIETIDESQRKAATVVGFAYVFALPPAIFAEFYVRTQLIAFGNAAQTAQNIMAHEPLFRLGIASNLTVSTGPLSGYYQWLPALVFQVVLGLWLLLRGAATHAEDQKPAGR